MEALPQAVTQTTSPLRRTRSMIKPAPDAVPRATSERKSDVHKPSHAETTRLARQPSAARRLGHSFRRCGQAPGHE
jgi:hypothetical protein